MMEYEVFKKVVASRIKEFLPLLFEEFEVQMHKVPKINGTKEAMILELDRKNARFGSPNVYLDDLYNEFKINEDMEAVLRKAGQIILSYTCLQLMDKNAVDLNQYRDCIVKMLINTEKNGELLEMSPHREYMDLSVVYRMAIEKEDGSGYATVMMTDDVCAEMDIDIDELDRLAEINNKRILETKKFQMSDAICVLTTKDKMYGAVNLMRPDVLAAAAEHMDDDLYILPTSIHEIMVVKEKCNTLDFLKSMLKEGNKHTVDEDEYLSDTVYRYNRKTGMISIAG